MIDDFGRQRVEPRDLFTRWIIPLGNRVDYLTLHTGKKIQVPFEQLLIFASNLDSADFADFAEEAFLRRLGYRLTAESPSSETYGCIFKKCVQACHLRYDPGLLDTLLARYTHEQREMRSCQPRDLIDRCRDICRYENRPFLLTKELLERAGSTTSEPTLHPSEGLGVHARGCRRLRLRAISWAAGHPKRSATTAR